MVTLCNAGDVAVACAFVIEEPCQSATVPVRLFVKSDIRFITDGELDNDVV